MTSKFRKKQNFSSTITVMRQLYNDYSLNTIRSLKDNIKQFKKEFNLNQCEFINLTSQSLSLSSFQPISKQYQRSHNDQSYETFNQTKIGHTFKTIINKIKKDQTVENRKKCSDMETTLLSKRFNFKKLSRNNLTNINDLNNIINQKNQNQDFTKRKGVNYTEKFTQFLNTINSNSSSLSLSSRYYDKKIIQQQPKLQSNNNKFKFGLTQRKTNSRKEGLTASLIRRKQNKKASHFLSGLNRCSLQNIENINRGYFNNQYTKNHPFFQPHKFVIEKLTTLQKIESSNVQNHIPLINNEKSSQKFIFSINNLALKTPRLNLKEMKQLKIKLNQFLDVKREKSKILRENYILKNNYGKNLNINNSIEQKSEKRLSEIKDKNHQLKQFKINSFLETKQNIFPYSIEKQSKKLILPLKAVKA